MKRRISLILILIVILACSTSTDSDDTTKPKSITYTPNSVSINVGESIVSNAPIVDDGGKSIIKYEFVQTVSGITIDEKSGIINVSNVTAVGSYLFDIILTNKNGSATFVDVFQVNILETTTKPVSMSYSPNSVSFFSTLQGNSSVPIINTGGSAITSIALIGTIPTGISINSSTGVITTNGSTPIGSHNLSVSLTNALGTTEFQNVLTIVIKDIATAITYTNNVRPLILIKCTPCHVDGGDQPNWTIYANAKAKANLIATRTGNGEMPRNGANGGLTEEQKAIFAKWVDDGILE